MAAASQITRADEVGGRRKPLPNPKIETLKIDLRQKMADYYH